MTRTRSLCDICKYFDVIVEVRGGVTTQYPSCDYFHAWFRNVRDPKHCRNFEPADYVGD
jgi:hypothetical protein